jgi:hypothetical protein
MKLKTYFFFNGQKMARLDPVPGGSVIDWPPESKSVIQDHGCADPDPKEIYRVRIHNTEFYITINRVIQST